MPTVPPFPSSPGPPGPLGPLGRGATGPAGAPVPRASRLWRAGVAVLSVLSVIAVVAIAYLGTRPAPAVTGGDPTLMDQHATPNDPSAPRSRASTPPRTVAPLDARGFETHAAQVAWSAPLPDGMQPGNEGVPFALVAGPTVLVGKADGSLQAFDRITGVASWSPPTAVNEGQMLITTAGDDTFVVSSAKAFRALDATTGAARWTHDGDALAATVADAAHVIVNTTEGVVSIDVHTGETRLLHSGLVDALALAGGVLTIAVDGGLTAMDPANGTARWTTPIPPSHHMNSYPGQMLAASKTTVIAVTDTAVLGFDSTLGTRVWTFEMSVDHQAVDLLTILAHDDERVVLVGHLGSLRALALPSGALLWIRPSSDDAAERPLTQGVLVGPFLVATTLSAAKGVIFLDLQTGQPAGAIAFVNPARANDVVPVTTIAALGPTSFVAAGAIPGGPPDPPIGLVALAAPSR